MDLHSFFNEETPAIDNLEGFLLRKDFEAFWNRKNNALKSSFSVQFFRNFQLFLDLLLVIATIVILAFKAYHILVYHKHFAITQREFWILVIAGVILMLGTCIVNACLLNIWILDKVDEFLTTENIRYAGVTGLYWTTFKKSRITLYEQWEVCLERKRPLV